MSLSEVKPTSNYLKFVPGEQEVGRKKKKKDHEIK